jgi:hypothetical protein
LQACLKKCTRKARIIYAASTECSVPCHEVLDLSTLPDIYVRAMDALQGKNRRRTSLPAQYHAQHTTPAMHTHACWANYLLTIVFNLRVLSQTTAKAALKGTASHKHSKVYKNPTFHRPKTLKLSRSPRYPRKSIPHVPRFDATRIIDVPLNTESWVARTLFRRCFRMNADDIDMLYCRSPVI